MVAQLLGLRLRSMLNGFRRSPWAVVGVLVAIAFGAVVTVLGAGVVAGLREAPVGTAEPFVVTVGALVTASALLLPALLGTDASVDPRRFALLGVSRRTLSIGLAVATLVGPAAIAVACIALSTVVTWARGPGVALVAAVAAVLAVATFVLAARTGSAASALVLRDRRPGVLGGIVVTGLAVLGPVLVSVGARAADGGGPPDAFRGSADVLAVTPLGAAWAVPASVAAGDAGGALLRLAIALAALGVLWLVWERLVERLLTTQPRSTRVRRFRGLGWFDRMPATPAGVIAARSLTYWARDPRYAIALLAMPVVPVVLLVALPVAGAPVGVVALFAVPFMALFLGGLPHNDIAYDHTAIWQHVAATPSGLADRIGRLVPVLAIGAVVVGAGSLLAAGVSPVASALPVLIGVSANLLLAGAGVASITSARLPYPVVRPGDSPFSHPQASGAAAATSSLVCYGAALAVSVPAIVCAVLWATTDGWGWGVAALVIGLVSGLATLVLGVLLGARVMERRGPELLAAALRA